MSGSESGAGDETNIQAETKAKMAENFHKIRLPKWDTEDPELWFQLCEDTFTIAQCEDQKVQAILVQQAFRSNESSRSP